MYFMIWLTVSLMTFWTVITFFIGAATIMTFAVIFIVKWVMSQFFKMLEEITTKVICDLGRYRGSNNRQIV